MGVETALMIGFGALQAVSTIGAANKEAKAKIAEGNIASQNKARETALRAGRLQSSFLSSGLTLEGTPMAAINDTFNTGIKDLNAIGMNYNNAASNIISSGRSAALGKLASSFGTTMFSSPTISPVNNTMGQSITGIHAASPTTIGFYPG